MGTKILALALCMGVLAGTAAAQQGSKPAVQSHGLQVAVTFVPERAKFSGGNCGCFWLAGGGLQIERTFQRGWSGVAEFTGTHAASVPAGYTGLDLYTVTAGPRYTWRQAHSLYGFFGQALAGGGFGRNGVFPQSSGATSSSASSVALKVGGGLNGDVAPRLTWRMVEANWLYTRLDNAGTNQQHTLQLETGLVYHF